MIISLNDNNNIFLLFPTASENGTTRKRKTRQKKHKKKCKDAKLRKLKRLETENTVANEATNKKKIKLKGFGLVVGGLPPETTKQQVAEHFSVCGKVAKVRLPSDEEGKCRGSAFVHFEDPFTYEVPTSLSTTMCIK